MKLCAVRIWTDDLEKTAARDCVEMKLLLSGLVEERG